jgi:hypothetical protein
MSQSPNGRFVPSGVNAQSWLGFEQRIQERRFRALLETMNQAIAAGDAIAARIALEEARELRPTAPELADIEDRLAAMPILKAPAASSWVHSRALGAVMLLLIGITLLMGLDWIRASEQAIPDALPLAASPAPPVATPAIIQTAPVQAPVTIVPPPAADELATPAAVGTSGLDRAIRAEPAATIRPRPFRAASTIDTRMAVENRPYPVVNGETPDDFVFVPPPPPAPSRPAVRTAAPAAGGRPLVASPAAAASALSAITRPEVSGDQTRVAAVLNQYARAYGQLDAGAAREVWPTVNERALARAFAGLASQDVAFDDCQIDVIGTRANASCRGQASYVGKIGSGEQRTEARTWRFELRRDGEAWKIENAEARRQ